MPQSSVMPTWKAVLLGAALVCALPAIFSTWIAPRIISGNLMAEVSRMLEGAAPLFLLFTLALAALLALLRLRKAALLLCLLVTLGGLSLGLRVFGQSQPVQPGPTALTAIWWNMYGKNPHPPADLRDAILAQDADLVILAEAESMRPVLPDLAERYPHQLGCDRKWCDMLVLSRLPLEGAGPWLSAPYLGSNGWADNERLAMVRVSTPEGPVTVLAVHLTKAWYGSAHRAERRKLRNVLTRLSGPLLVLGDFNAAPWSAVISGLTRDRDLQLIWGAPVTWPARLQRFGIAIDHVLVRGGTGLSRLDTFAPEHGSNHRGLLATVTLP